MPAYEKKWTERLELTDEAKRELGHVRDHNPKAYVRERAAAILKVAAGQEPEDVAERGLLKPRDRDSLYEWLRRYVAEGIDGLYMRAGRGRKPAFSPSDGGGGAGTGAGGGRATAADAGGSSQPVATQ